MSYLDEPEYGEPRDDRESGRRSARRRATQPTRPAWDAATYGTPEDLRRARRGSASDRYTAGDPDPHPSYGSDSYGSDSYGSDSYGSDSYGSDSYGSSYAAEPYRAASTRVSDYVGGIDDPPGPDFADPDFAGPDFAGPDFAGPDIADPNNGALPSEPGTTGPGPMAPGPMAPGPIGPGPIGPAAPAVKPSAAGSGGRAGRNLPAAIAVGLGLGAAAVASLFLWRPAFLGVIALAVGIGTWELVRAVRTRGANPPLIPLIAGGVLMSGLAWWGQTDGLAFGLVVTVLAVMVWRLADGVAGYGRDVSSAALIAVYLPFLAGFAALMVSTPADGDLRMIVTLAAVVLTDTGGYVAGVFFGRHPMAPTVSPKKSWEGLAGSLVATAIGGAVLLRLLFDVAPWWGALFGLGVSAASVLGDLAESMIKRDLEIKDMSSLLPGHGGLMDRLDSILFALPVAYLLLLVIAPPG